MADPKLKKWKHAGKLHVWSYVPKDRNYPGYHLTCDTDACISLLSLTEIFETSELGGKVSIPLDAVSQQILRVPNCSSKASSYDELRLAYSPDISSGHWSIWKNGRLLCVEVGTENLLKLLSGIRDVSEVRGDYAIGSNDERLWFWWYPDSVGNTV